MAMHLVAFAQSVTAAPAAIQALDPVPDATVTVAGKLMYVPSKYNQVIRAAILGKAGTLTQAQLQAPSLRELFFPDLTPLRVGTEFTGDNDMYDLGSAPLQLVTSEGLEVLTDGNNTTTAVDEYGLVFLSDGPIQAAKGKIYTMRATAGVALAARAWVNGPLTMDQSLPVGKYQILGMRAMGSGLVAARLVFIGPSAVTRPGVLGYAGEQTSGMEYFRFGRSGTFGEFDSVTPPSVDCLGDTGTAQTFELDLVKTS
jgi:hypothetical protein